MDNLPDKGDAEIITMLEERLGRLELAVSHASSALSGQQAEAADAIDEAVVEHEELGSLLKEVIRRLTGK
ncbi:hypothetical protein [Actinoplanes aureus]|uniref:Uncharacterized protein n=1 Tax=Actinoplanes aureus TaxID=2792083 RepID=A0A931C279_9ACTN|nr:hypothetical protein [Actinoplanes aureus]MBG0561995.1 hypothetical protein [Actinoplanes aureus]